ncbi:hypothetical protein LIER_33503 [Lithospermum erythrorhizon]|uniref:Transmembrane protein n=1 Tax=Lithospermum erythrorhizon TaxID=34254 RepID=A0AAV3S0C4_LITER
MVFWKRGRGRGCGGVKKIFRVWFDDAVLASCAWTRGGWGWGDGERAEVFWWAEDGGWLEWAEVVGAIVGWWVDVVGGRGLVRQLGRRG